MKSITLADWLVIVVYLVAVVAIGVHTARMVKSSASFFISNRRLGKLLMTFFYFGSGTSSDQAVSVAAKTYQTGISGIWYQWLWLPLTPFYWLLGAVLRRMRAVTIADFFEARFGRSVSYLYAVMGILQLAVGIGLLLKGSGLMITAVSGGEINPTFAIVVMTVLFVIYGIAGGLAAAAYTDLIQGILTIGLSFLILPFALFKVGGMAGLREAIGDPSMFQLIAPGEITVFFICVVAFNGLVGAFTYPTCMVCGAGNTEMTSRLWGPSGLIKRICTVAWVLTGLCGLAIYADQQIDVEQIYGLMAHDILPVIAPGLLGLFIASMLASVMSTCDASMIMGSGLFVENIYRPLQRKKKIDRHYILAGRVASVVIVLGSLLFAYSLESIITGLEIYWKIVAMMGISAWVGMFWRRATVSGAWAGTLAAFFTFLFTERVSLGILTWDFNVTVAPHLPDFMLFDNKLFLPWQMLAYLCVGFIVLVIVSLFTKPVAGEKLDRFYECLRTPVTSEEPETKPFTLPEGIKPAPRRVLIKHPDFEIPVPSKVAVLGFLGLWIIVALMVGAAGWIFSLGK